MFGNPILTRSVLVNRNICLYYIQTPSARKQGCNGLHLPVSGKNSKHVSSVNGAEITPCMQKSRRDSPRTGRQMCTYMCSTLDHHHSTCAAGTATMPTCCAPHHGGNRLQNVCSVSCINNTQILISLETISTQTKTRRGGGGNSRLVQAASTQAVW